MEFIILLILFFGSGYVIVFIIDTLLGKSSFAQKQKRKKVQESLNKKIQDNSKLSEEELEYFIEQQRMNNLINNLSRHSRK